MLSKWLFSCVSLLWQLCESLEELLNVNGELRSEGQAIWTLLGGILGQVGCSCCLSTHNHLPKLVSGCHSYRVTVFYR